jgi:hypothetical protein
MHLGVIGLHPLHSPSFVKVCFTSKHIFGLMGPSLHFTLSRKLNVKVVTELHCCFIRRGLWFGYLLDTSRESFKSDIKRPGKLNVSWSQHMMIKNITRLPWEDCRPVIDPTTSSTMHFPELCKESGLQNGVDIYKFTPLNMKQQECTITPPSCITRHSATFRVLHPLTLIFYGLFFCVSNCILYFIVCPLHMLFFQVMFLGVHPMKFDSFIRLCSFVF